jgi:hypothetical protein
VAIDSGIAGERNAATRRPPASRATAHPSLPHRVAALRRRPTALATLAAIAIVAVLGILALSNSANGYTGADRTHFVAGCLKNGGATKAQCGCMFDRISSQLPHDDFAKANATAQKDWSPRTARTFSGAVVACTASPMP